MAVAHKSEPRVRVQVVTPRSARRVKKSHSRQAGAARIGKALKNAAAFAKPAAILIAAVLMIVGYNTLASSSVFELRHVEVSSNTASLGADIEQVVRRAVGRAKLLDVDLAAIRQKVEAMARVRSATVARVLPDGLYVDVAERQPSVLVRRESGSLVWLDSDAVEMGEVSDLRSETPDSGSGGEQTIPPIAKGFAEDGRSQAAAAEDRERIAVYKQIERELGEGPNPIWSLVDEIDLTSPKYVNLRLTSSNVTVVVGGKDFRNRFETALQILGAIKRGDAELLGRFRVQDPARLIENADYINFIDAARPDRIVLNFSTPGREKIAKQEPKRGDK